MYRMTIGQDEKIPCPLAVLCRPRRPKSNIHADGSLVVQLTVLRVV